jgi:hypothetical protein
MKIEESSVVETQDFRILIYPASRSMSAKEVKEITEILFDFLPTWNAHGNPLSSSFKIDFSQFIIISIDEEKVPASGCSIDALGEVIRKIDQQYQLGFFDRMKASFLENGQVKTLPLMEFKKAIRNKELPMDIEVFDFSKDTYLNYLSDFKLPLVRSWAGILL